jgi:hypothetical protein
MSPHPWTILLHPTSSYTVEENNFSLEIFPYQKGTDIHVSYQNITSFTNITQWWIEALQFNKSDSFLYQILLSNQSVVNSLHTRYVIAFFFPGNINQSFLNQIGSKISTISNFKIVNINKFVGETTIAYDLYKNSINLHVSITFDERYDGIASLTISSSNSKLSIYLIKTNNENRPENLVQLLFNLIVVIFISSVLTIFILILSFLKKKYFQSL